jgi:hypothetical protein
MIKCKYCKVALNTPIIFQVDVSITPGTHASEEAGKIFISRLFVFLYHICMMFMCWYLLTINHIGGVMVSMVSMLSSCVVDCGVKYMSDQTKDDQIGICYFSAKHAAVRSKS